MLIIPFWRTPEHIQKKCYQISTIDKSPQYKRRTGNNMTLHCIRRQQRRNVHFVWDFTWRLKTAVSQLRTGITIPKVGTTLNLCFRFYSRSVRNSDLDWAPRRISTSPRGHNWIGDFLVLRFQIKSSVAQQDEFYGNVFKYTLLIMNKVHALRIIATVTKWLMSDTSIFVSKSENFINQNKTSIDMFKRLTSHFV